MGFIWIYTHAEFEKRPPDKNLKHLLLEIMDNYDVSDESKKLDGTVEIVKLEKTKLEKINQMTVKKHNQNAAFITFE